ncbi:orotidine-5'-phosphate decarboxylase [Roseibium litorale]|uniref:Orotidine-5'-phosphate decarboxylase n=1 Tax=Roseibium litorale TaxID=2803841 RepID=A0ABR9CL42_9HYPH|nr:orotidine-5'-phosphate decarboxylase [Roseibium litorale]MBD8891269.1 orotidine-5'-phosphate decarboxylase [Roseibium litorale]
MPSGTSSRTWVEIVEANAARYGDLVAGIDPSLPDLPRFFEQDDGSGWIGRFTDFLLETIEGHVGFVKFQAAYFEAGGLTGLNALSSGMKRAKAAGIGVILDAKRGDIGATASAYARAYLTPPEHGGSGDFEADCLTVNPLMGPDTLAPFADCVTRFGKGLFVLCRTSNPGAGWLQDKMAGNRQISDRVADMIAGLAAPDGEGLAPVGAVIGATVPNEGRRLRHLLPRSIILAPGLGAQGGDIASIHALRGPRPGDLLVPVSRGLTQVEDRGISLQAYRGLILERIDRFKTAIGRDPSQVQPATRAESRTVA